MEKYLSFIPFIVAVFYLYKKNENNKKQKDFTAWCFSSKYSCLISLSDTIHNIQIDLNIPKEYRLCSNEEWASVEVVLDDFKIKMLHKYFSNELDLPKIKPTYKMEEQLFMLYLQDYLKNHQCDYTFLGHEMHEKENYYKSFGSWGTENYMSSYKQTDFAIALHKLYYISFLFCENDKILNPKWIHNKNEKSAIENIIRTRTISISQIS